MKAGKVPALSSTADCFYLPPKKTCILLIIISGILTFNNTTFIIQLSKDTTVKKEGEMVNEERTDDEQGSCSR